MKKNLDEFSKSGKQLEVEVHAAFDKNTNKIFAILFRTTPNFQLCGKLSLVHKCISIHTYTRTHTHTYITIIKGKSVTVIFIMQCFVTL